MMQKNLNPKCLWFQFLVTNRVPFVSNVQALWNWNVDNFGWLVKVWPKHEKYLYEEWHATNTEAPITLFITKIILHSFFHEKNDPIGAMSLAKVKVRGISSFLSIKLKNSLKFSTMHHGNVQNCIEKQNEFQNLNFSPSWAGAYNPNRKNDLHVILSVTTNLAILF